MKKLKKETALITQLNDLQMKNISGGGWIQFTNPDGTITKNLGIE